MSLPSLRIHTGGYTPKNVAISGLSKGVDLDLGRVLVLEDLVQTDEDIRRLVLGALSLKAQLLRKSDSGVLVETLLEVDGGGDNRTRVLRGDFLDVHTTLSGRDQHRSTNVAIVQDGNIVLVGRVPTLGQHDLVRMSIKSVNAGEVEGLVRRCRRAPQHRFAS